MPILNPCVRQIDKWSFIVEDVQTQQAYDSANIDLTTVTAASVTFKNLYDNETYTVNVLSNWAYLLGDGLTINIANFPTGTTGDLDYFPDWIKTKSIEPYFK